MIQSYYPTHLVVGIDFSDGALSAFRAARALSTGLGAELHLLHVREPGPEAEEAPDARMRHWLHRAGADADQLRFRIGQPWRELAREATALAATALVIGSHGRAGVQPIALGSTAVKLGLAAPCPLIVVGPRAHWPRAAATYPTPIRG